MIASLLTLFSITSCTVIGKWDQIGNFTSCVVSNGNQVYVQPEGAHQARIYNATTKLVGQIKLPANDSLICGIRGSEKLYLNDSGDLVTQELTSGRSSLKFKGAVDEDWLVRKNLVLLIARKSLFVLSNRRQFITNLGFRDLVDLDVTTGSIITLRASVEKPQIDFFNRRNNVWHKSRSVAIEDRNGNAPILVVAGSESLVCNGKYAWCFAELARTSTQALSGIPKLIINPAHADKPGYSAVRRSLMQIDLKSGQAKHRVVLEFWAGNGDGTVLSDFSLDREIGDRQRIAVLKGQILVFSTFGSTYFYRL